MMNPSHSHENDERLWDGLGLTLSGLCALHCLALPLGLFALLPFLDRLPDEHEFHWAMALAIVPIGLIAFWRGYRRHHNRAVLISGALGLILIAIGTGSGSGELAHREFPITLIASLALIFAHFKNWRLSRCESCANS